LAEESYEWHKNGLSEDGTINLEAPRKWRLLRERTGHGAFYGMRIIIYGECMTPPLVCFLLRYVYLRLFPWSSYNVLHKLSQGFSFPENGGV